MDWPTETERSRFVALLAATPSGLVVQEADGRSEAVHESSAAECSDAT